MLGCRFGSKKSYSELPDTKEEGHNFPAFLKAPYAGKYELFIGKSKIDVTHEQVYGIEFEVVDSLTIDYRITQMINWQNAKEINGVAQLDLETLKHDNIRITNWSGTQTPAYKFSSLKNNCLIEILISKNNLITMSTAQAFRVCNHKIDTLTTPLHHK